MTWKLWSQKARRISIYRDSLSLFFANFLPKKNDTSLPANSNPLDILATIRRADRRLYPHVWLPRTQPVLSSPAKRGSHVSVVGRMSTSGDCRAPFSVFQRENGLDR